MYKKFKSVKEQIEDLEMQLEVAKVLKEQGLIIAIEYDLKVLRESGTTHISYIPKS